MRCGPTSRSAASTAFPSSSTPSRQADLPAAAHVAAVLEMRKLMDRAARWLLRNAPRPMSVDSVVERYREGVEHASRIVRSLPSEPAREEARAASAALARAGVPARLVERLAVCSQLPSALDIAEVARRHGPRAAGSEPEGPAIALAAEVWYGVDALLDIGWLQGRIAALPRADRWQALARGALRGDLLRRHRALASQILLQGGGARPDAALRTWRNANARAIQRWTALVADLRTEPHIEYPMMAVALRELREVGSESRDVGPSAAESASRPG